MKSCCVLLATAFALLAVSAQTPTPTPTVSISGTILYCSNPFIGPVPNVTLTLTGDAGISMATDGSGNYILSSLASGGSYDVTPSKAARTPGSIGINTVDVLATQRHFLQVVLLAGCRLTAADVNGDTAINTVDVIAIQRFYLGLITGIANVGKYKFAPVSRSYFAIGSDEAGQNFDTLIFGDVTSPFAVQSALDGFDPNANDLVRVICPQPDGKVIIGGEFTAVSPNGGATVTRRKIARLNADGALDTAFDPNVNPPPEGEASVYAIVVQADGKILVAGAFNTIGGQTRSRIARLDGVTGLADSFNPNALGSVWSIAVQTDGKILAAGYFSGRNKIARFNPDGTLDSGFNPNASNDDYVYCVAVQADGKILVGGSFHGANSFGGQTRNYIARLDATSGLPDSFDPNPDGKVLAITVQSDGKILVGGDFRNIGGQDRNGTARLNATTGLADSFDPRAHDVHSINLQTDGKILVGGGFIGGVGGQIRHNIARIDATTGLADWFDPNANGDVYSIAQQADGSILAAGYFSTIGGQTRNHVVRILVAVEENGDGAAVTVER